MSEKKRKHILSLLCCGLVISVCVSCVAGGGDNINEADTITVFGNFTDSIRVSEPETESERAIDAWYSLLEEKNGVKLDIESPPNANYSERLQIMLAGGQYPDMIAFPEPTDAIFISAVKKGKIISLNRYLEHAPNIMKYTLDASWDALKTVGDGNIYAIPRSTVMRADGYWVRKDWLERVGLSIPEDGVVSLSEFTEILKRFTENDPDGNGENDTYGLGYYLNDEGYLEPPVSFPFGLLGWQEHSGGYAYMDEKYCREHHSYEKALAYSAELFKNGYLDPSCFTVKPAAAVNNFYTGKIGVMSGFSLHTSSALNTMKYYNPEADITYITAIRDEAGETKGTMEGNGIYWAWGISSSAEKPEKIVGMLDWILSDEGWETSKRGLEGYNYTVNEYGEKEPVRTDDGRRVSVSTGTMFLRRADDTEIYMMPSETGETTPPQSLCENWLKRCMDNFVPGLDAGYTPSVITERKFAEANKELALTIAKIISGELPVSAYSSRLDDWYAAGGSEYVEDMNRHIAEKKN